MSLIPQIDRIIMTPVVPRTPTEKLPEYKIMLLGSQGVGKTAIGTQLCDSYFNSELRYDPTGYNYRKVLIVDNQASVIETMDVDPGSSCDSLDHCIRSSDAFMLVYSVGDKSSCLAINAFYEQVKRIKYAKWHESISASEKTHDRPSSLRSFSSTASTLVRPSGSIDHLAPSSLPRTKNEATLSHPPPNPFSPPAPIILLANKSDLPLPHAVTLLEGSTLARSLPPLNMYVPQRSTDLQPPQSNHHDPVPLLSVSAADNASITDAFAKLVRMTNSARKFEQKLEQVCKDEEERVELLARDDPPISGRAGKRKLRYKGWHHGRIGGCAIL